MLIHDEYYTIVIVMNMLERPMNFCANVKECMIYVYTVPYINLEIETKHCCILSTSKVLLLLLRWKKLGIIAYAWWHFILK